MKTSKVLLFFLLFLSTSKVHAGLFDFSGFYFSDSFSNGTSSTYNRTFFDVCLGTSLTKDFYVGWDYVSTSATDNPGTAETLTSTQMGLKFFYFFGHSKTWRLAAAYNLSTTGSYTGASTSGATWKGTSIEADLGAAVPISESAKFTLRLNYVSLTFADQFVGTAYTQISTTRAFIYPSLGVTWEL